MRFTPSTMFSQVLDIMASCGEPEVAGNILNVGARTKAIPGKHSQTQPHHKWSHEASIDKIIRTNVQLCVPTSYFCVSYEKTIYISCNMIFAQILESRVPRDWFFSTKARLQKLANLSSRGKLDKVEELLKEAMVFLLSSEHKIQRPSQKIRGCIARCQASLGEGHSGSFAFMDPRYCCSELIWVYFHMAHAVAVAWELHHFWSWDGSIRTTSGQSASYSDGKSVFPSDTILYVSPRRSGPRRLDEWLLWRWIGEPTLSLRAYVVCIALLNVVIANLQKQDKLYPIKTHDEFPQRDYRSIRSKLGSSQSSLVRLMRLYKILGAKYPVNSAGSCAVPMTPFGHWWWLQKLPP